MFFRKLTYLIQSLFWTTLIFITSKSEVYAELKVLYLIIEIFAFMFFYNQFLDDDWK